MVLITFSCILIFVHENAAVVFKKVKELKPLLAWNSRLSHRMHIAMVTAHA